MEVGSVAPITKREFRRPTEAFVTFCDVLRLSDELIDKAWESYDRVSTQCVLEGDEKPWIACAIYISIWRSVTTIQLADDDPNANVSMNTLLKLSGLSVLELFEKLTKWTEVVNAPRRVQEHVSRVQGNFAVSAVVFKKFLPVFRRVFRPVVTTTNSANAPLLSAPYRPPPTISVLFELCWMLYASGKKHFSGVGDDLLNCFHLSLCCVDLVHKNLLSMGLSEMLTPEYVSLDGTTESAEVLARLCDEFEGVMLDAKHFRVHWWIPKLKKWMTDGYSLVGNADDQTGLVENMQENLTRLHASYETAMLKRGEMDERILIPDDVDKVFQTDATEDPLINLKRSPEKKLRDIDTDLMLRMSVQACLEKIQQRVTTPLSGKSYIISGEQFVPESPVSTAVHAVAKLTLLIDAAAAAPSDRLLQLFQQCATNPNDFISARVHKLTSMAEDKMKEEDVSYDASFSEFYRQRLDQAECLYYRLLESVILPEKARSVQLGKDFLAPLLKDVFHSTLYACALELVLFSYGSEREFPWVLEALKLPAFHFYKAIEIIIRSESKMSREMVKHLNMVEERVLEELAWSSDSPLWAAIELEGVPSCQEVALPNDIDRVTGVPAVSTDDERGCSVRFSSPMKAAAKRKLEFNDDVSPAMDATAGPQHAQSSSDERPIVQPIRLPGSTVITGSEDKSSTITSTTAVSSDTAVAETSEPKPPVIAKKFSSSVALFFRKVYYLASVRLMDLCDRLRLNERSKRTVWTLFSHFLRYDTVLMADRHLDQNLMCCVYVVGKILREDGCSFHDIMYHYRHQPQAHSTIYRRVLMDVAVHDGTITRDATDDSGTESLDAGVKCSRFRSESTLPLASGTSGEAGETKPEFGDLIQYYNRVFILRLEDFVKKLVPSSADGDTKENAGDGIASVGAGVTDASGQSLAALPSVRSQVLSPRKCVSDGVFVQPMHSPVPPSPSSRPMRYNFNRSPYKDLKAINSMIRQGDRPSALTSDRFYRLSRLFRTD